MSNPPANPPPQPPTRPPDTRPPTKPPNKADAEIFAAAELVRADLATPTVPPAPKPELPKPVGPPRFQIFDGEHRLVGRVAEPAESEAEVMARLMVAAVRPAIPGS